jgi:hypothetical protein
MSLACVCVCVCVSVCARARVFVCERERERDSARKCIIYAYYKTLFQANKRSTVNISESRLAQLDSKPLFTKHLQTVLHKATGTLLEIFPLVARDSPLTIPNKILLYKLLLCSTITYAAPVWSSTSPTNYRHLQVYQSKCLRFIGDFPRRTPISNLHAHLQIIPIRQSIYHLTDKFFVRCPVHPNPLIRNTGNYTLEDLQRQYTNYRHKRIKHILLLTL